MKPFNSELNTDITKLKEILASNGRKSPEYTEMFKNIMKNHNISRSTVYLELDKDMPGSYKKTDRKAWMVKISKREIDLVAELLIERKKNNTELCKAMSVEMGFSYTLSRLNKVKQKIYSASAIIIKKEPGIIKHTISAVPEDMNFREQANTISQPKCGAWKFFYELSGIDLSNLKSIIRLKIGASEYDVSGRVIKECLDHIAASASSGGKDITELTKFDIETLLLQQLKYARLNEYISPKELKELTAIHKTLLHQETNSHSGGYTLDDVFRVVQHFSPETKREEVAKVLES